jgi:predicted HTH transcriptional regulator
MTAAQLQELLQQGEGQRLEFKEDAIKPSDLAQTLVALANAQGGMVLIGVNDAGQPVGMHSYQQTYDLVMTAASPELCDPPIPLGVDSALEGTHFPR